MAAWNLLARILDYPEAGFAARLHDDLARMTEPAPIGKWLRDFEDSVNSIPPARLEEIYTATFDLRPDCSPFAGYHLFGDDSRRGIFLVRLKGHYDRLGFSIGRQLPDHVPAMLRFLAERARGEEEQELIDECLLPAVTKMAGACEPANPYYAALQALLLSLQDCSQAPDSTGEKPWTTCS